MVTDTPAVSAARTALASRAWGLPLASSSVPSRSIARSLPEVVTSGRSSRRHPARSGLSVDRDLALRARAPLVLHDAVDQGEQREVLAQAHIAACMDRRADLAHENTAGGHLLAAVHLHAALLRVRVPPVARASCTLFVSHGDSSVRARPDLGEVRPDQPTMLVIS